MKRYQVGCAGLFLVLVSIESAGVAWAEDNTLTEKERTASWILH